MAVDISLMVLPRPSADEEALPQIFLYQHGMWRDTPTGGSGPVIGLTRTRCVIDTILMQIMTAVDEAGEQPQPGSLTNLRGLLRAKFRAAYQNIVPEDVRRALKNAAEAPQNGDVPLLRIHLHPRYEWIPWEIMHDGDTFLGLRFQIARVPIVAAGPDPGNGQAHRVSRIYNLLGQHVVTPGSALYNDWTSTFSALIPVPTHEVRYPGINGAANNWPEIDQVAEAETADILHITCHGGLRDDQDEVYWTLDHRAPWYIPYRINSSDVAMLNLRATSPLVFGNACASAQEGGLIPGLGSTFFSQGALDFVGTFAPISKRVAIGFACKFYRLLLGDRLPVGRALWATKKHYQEQGEEDPSWLFYCLYGLPETRFEPAP